MQLQDENQDMQARLQAVIDSAIDGIITIDSKGTVETINPAGAKMFGYEADNIIGCNINMLMPEPYHAEHDGYLKRYKDTGKRHIIGVGREVQGLRKDGTTFPFRLSVAEVKLYGRKIFTGIIHDISDKVLANEIQKALDKERQLNKLKSKFVSMASHEFRTPLTTIATSATLIGKYEKTEEQFKRVKHINRIKNSIRILTNILNDFLSLSKLEEGKTKHQPMYFSLEDFAQEVAEEMEEAVSKLGQKIVYQHIGTEDQVFLDKKLLNNVLINLLSNAIKYSDNNKHIELTTEINPEEIKISVQDYGIGIPKNEQGQLFERFFRADNVGNIQGTGLGLNIVKRYLELMEGNITCHSELNEGTLFVITFVNNNAK
jgi:two-component system sensor kinase FixL